MEFDYSLVEKLKVFSWFSNCGAKNAKSKYDIVYAGDLKSVIKHLDNIDHGRKI